MNKLSLSEKYALAAALLLLLVAAVNNALITLVVSLLGFAVGVVVARAGPMRRAGVVGLVGFAVAAVLASVILLRP